eukprot:TRINITY_DN9443_c0_g1_i1.p1 TRINITY_DN9443_c0_g1~~TRINITY_DN9443_c0_g1_i1.p1  ORF type:complete len:281 (+),score=54.55 TRINITY_DN9443_c0_g1_i1:90-845(+)
MLRETALRWLRWWPVIAGAVTVVASVAARGFGDGKWVRVKADPGASVCLVDTGAVNSSTVCCKSFNPWPTAPCEWLPINGFLTSLLAACVLPLLEPLVSWWTAPGNASNRKEPLASPFNRLVAIAALIVVRMVVYAAKLEWMTHERPDSCWYQDLRYDGRCAVAHDPSDHIFLTLVQYLAPLGLSLQYGCKSANWKAALCALAVAYCNFSRNTALYYHTGQDSLIAVAFALLLLLLMDLARACILPARETE